MKRSLFIIVLLATAGHYAHAQLWWTPTPPSVDQTTYISRSGYVGVGTKMDFTPSNWPNVGQFEIYGDNTTSSPYTWSAFVFNNAEVNPQLLRLKGGNAQTSDKLFQIEASEPIGLPAYNEGNYVLRAFSDRKVVIGDVSFANPDYSLFVEKGILTESVRVAEYGSALWPDYVFTPGYELQSLPSVKLFIQTKGHLPNIPSACEVEEKGFDLAEMDAKLLEKIEELTLYLISLNEELETLKTELETVKAQK